MTAHVLKVSDHRWAVVVDYGQHGGTGQRSGCWCEDQSGGWGVHNWDPIGAIDMCADPLTYRTRHEAMA